MKNLSARSKTSNNHQIRSQKSTILHDDKEVKWIISTINRNSNKIWFYHSTLSRKEQQLNKHFKQKIRFHQEKNQTKKASNVTNKQEKTNKIHTLLNYSNQKISKWTNQKKNLTRQIHEKNNQKNWETFWNENHKKTVTVSKTNLHIICNKKKNDRMTS